jgi:hypothetical protein
MACMNDVLELLKGMKGVVHAFVLDNGCRDKIWDIEKDIKAAMGIPVVNKGVEECLKRQYVVCIIKKASFRPPPEPTVMLLTNSGVVLGEEILPSFKQRFLESVKEEIIWLSDEFVIYPERRGGNKEFFVMPPVSFPEVEDLGMKEVVSCSASAPADLMLRTMHGLEDDPKLASVLIGFDNDGVC